MVRSQLEASSKLCLSAKRKSKLNVRKPPNFYLQCVVKRCYTVLNQTHTHFDNLYSVSSISPMGRMAKNGKVEKSAETVWLNMVSNRTRKTRLQSCASLRSAAERNLFVGEYREEEPWNQRTAAGWTSGVIVLKAGTSVPRPELISSPCIASFVDGEAIQVSPSPAHVKWREWWWKTLCPGLDTHTQIAAFGAFFKNRWQAW